MTARRRRAAVKSLTAARTPHEIAGAKRQAEQDHRHGDDHEQRLADETARLLTGLAKSELCPLWRSDW